MKSQAYPNDLGESANIWDGAKIRYLLATYLPLLLELIVFPRRIVLVKIIQISRNRIQKTYPVFHNGLSRGRGTS